MKARSLLALPLALVICAGCAAWTHGFTLSRFQGQTLKVKAGGPGSERLRIERNFDETIGNFVRGHGLPDYIHVIDGNRVLLFYVDEDQVVLFQRGWVANSTYSVGTGIAENVASAFSADDRQRLAQRRRLGVREAPSTVDAGASSATYADMLRTWEPKSNYLESVATEAVTSRRPADCEGPFRDAHALRVEIDHVIPPYWRSAEHQAITERVGNLENALAACTSSNWPEASKQLRAARGQPPVETPHAVSSPPVTPPRPAHTQPRRRTPPAADVAERTPPSHNLPEAWQGKLSMRVRRTVTEATVRDTPSPFGKALLRLPGGTALSGLRRDGGWLEVVTPQGTRGYLPVDQAELAD